MTGKAAPKGIDAKSRQVLEDACRQKQPALFSGDAQPITFQTYVLAVGEDHVRIENRIKPRWINQVMKSAQFTLQAGMVRFSAESVRSDGEHIIFPLKEDSVIEETRQSERFSFAPDECVVCEVLNPFDGVTRLTKSVMDMSATGLSLRTTFESKLFAPGTSLPEVKVLIDGEPYAQATGRVVYTRRLIDLAGQLRTQVGIKFEGRS